MKSTNMKYLELAPYDTESTTAVVEERVRVGLKRLGVDRDKIPNSRAYRLGRASGLGALLVYVRWCQCDGGRWLVEIQNVNGEGLVEELCRRTVVQRTNFNSPRGLRLVVELPNDFQRVAGHAEASGVRVEECPSDALRRLRIGSGNGRDGRSAGSGLVD
jgi:hypothetical protein